MRLHLERRHTFRRVTGTGGGDDGTELLNTKARADHGLLRRTAIRNGFEGWLGNEVALRQAGHSKLCMDVSGLSSKGNFGDIVYAAQKQRPV
jgi:hypothetical protein